MVGAADFGPRVLAAVHRAFPTTPIYGLWLFGSYARGENTPRSDVDLGILAETALDPIALGAVATELERIAGARVDLVDLRRASVLLRVEATYEGRMIAAPQRFEADLFAAHALSDHASFAPNRRMATEAMREKFREG